MQKLYYFEIEGITKETHDKIVECVKNICPDLEFKSGFKVD